MTTTETTESVRMGGTGMGMRCQRCMLGGRLVHNRRDGTPLGVADQCVGCQEIICDRHGDRETWPKERHHASEHAASQENA